MFTLQKSLNKFQPFVSVYHTFSNIYNFSLQAFGYNHLRGFSHPIFFITPQCFCELLFLNITIKVFLFVNLPSREIKCIDFRRIILFFKLKDLDKTLLKTCKMVISYWNWIWKTFLIFMAMKLCSPFVDLNMNIDFHLIICQFWLYCK